MKLEATIRKEARGSNNFIQEERRSPTRAWLVTGGGGQLPPLATMSWQHHAARITALSKASAGENQHVPRDWGPPGEALADGAGHTATPWRPAPWLYVTPAAPAHFCSPWAAFANLRSRVLSGGREMRIRVCGADCRWGGSGVKRKKLQARRPTCYRLPRGAALLAVLRGALIFSYFAIL
jgi:hypothetical protein